MAEGGSVRVRIARAAVLSTLVAAFVLTSCAVAQKVVRPRVETHQLTRPDGEPVAYRYLLVEPPELEPGQKVPLVLFLHGAGERGDDPWQVNRHFVTQIVEPEFRERFPCYVVAPQCPREKTWSAATWSLPDSEAMPPEPTEPMRAAIEILERYLKLPGVDHSRVYLTGLSMGGFGSWELAARHPERFAAVIPICGGGDESQAKRLAGLPIWAFHGAEDRVVPAARSRDLVEAIRRAGGTPKYTEYAETGHDSWSQTYRDPDGALAWMFAQSKKPAIRAVDEDRGESDGGG